MTAAGPRPTPRRRIEFVRGAWGAALLAAPRTVLGSLDQVRIDSKSVVVTRILGARHLTQAVLSGASPSPEVLAMGIWVDIVHAATAVALAAGDRTRARGGLTDAAVAAIWAARGLHDLRTGTPPAPAHDRRRDALARAVLRRAPGGTALLHRVGLQRRTANNP